jgi:hypothetical protein
MKEKEDCSHSDEHTSWWERERLKYHQDGLYIGQSNAAEIASQAGTPVFI